jgi:FkbM family methyltransferase
MEEINQYVNCQTRHLKGGSLTFKAKTRYGSFSIRSANEEDYKELEENLCTDYFGGVWFSNIPVTFRDKMSGLRWLDINAGVGWFGVKLLCNHGGLPSTVFAIEPSTARRSFLEFNISNNDQYGGIISQHMFPVKKRTSRQITLNTDPDTAKISIDGKGKPQENVDTVDYSAYIKSHRINSIRMDMNGYEKELLLKGSISMLKILMCKLDLSKYDESERKKLDEKLEKRFNHIEYVQPTKNGPTYLFACVI